MPDTLAPRAPSFNRFQRWYFGWAEQHYARMAPAVRAEVERVDRYLYSQRGLVLWAGLMGATAAAIAAMTRFGVPLVPAIAIGCVVCFSLPFGALAAWLQPDRFTIRRIGRIFLAVVGFGYFGALIGFLVGRFEKHGGLQPETLGLALKTAAWQATPLLLVGMLVYFLLVAGVAHLRRVQLTRLLAQLSLQRERDAAARQAAEARLRLLQTQIQPHFVFNTLAALQHWVDVGDARAAPLLRALTGFLRGSTEMMLRDSVTLAQELEMVRHYLAIMQARLGERLRTAFSIAPECEAQALPPGLLITLVENAVEHGIEPQLRGGEVRVSARRLADGGFELRVDDDGVGLAPAHLEGVGLTNSRERLRHRFGTGAVLEMRPAAGGTGTEVCLRLAPDAVAA